MSELLERGKAPAEWCAIFKGKGMTISERTLRARARELSECYIIGAAMLITPEQIDRIMEEGACRSKRTQEERHGGRVARSTTTASRSPTTSAKALAHLRKQAQTSGSRTARR